MNNTTATIEEYLETIERLSAQSDAPVRPSAIAEYVSVSRPSVTTALRRMESDGLVERIGKGVVLTSEGREAARAVLRRHRVAELFLVQVLGMDPETVHDDACRLEHAISDTVLAAMEKSLNNPALCPHGQPIPE